MKCAIAAVGAALLLSACATELLLFSEAEPVDRSDIHKGYALYSKPEPGRSRVRIVRDPVFMGAAAGAQFSIDGEPVATLGRGQRLEVYLAPGRYIFGVLPTLGGGTGTLSESAQEIVAGKQHGYRISAQLGAFLLQPSAHVK